MHFCAVGKGILNFGEYLGYSNYGQRDFYMVLELLKLFNNVHYMLSLDDHGPSTQVML